MMRIWNAAFALCAVLMCIGMGGCETMGMEPRPGATSILAYLAPPSPEEAAKWAIDPYDADKRYRGTLLLAGAPFAGEPVYMRMFTDNAKDTDPGVRAAALRALGNHGTPATAPLIIERLGDAEANVRIEACRALQRIHAPESIDPLLALLNMDKELDPDVRVEAALALGQHAERKVLELLITTLDDPSLAVERSCQWSLRVLTGQDFGLDRATWAGWYKKNTDHFAARGTYTYPVFSRDKRWFEYIPFVPGPPNEQASTPAGMPMTVQ